MSINKRSTLQDREHCYYLVREVDNNILATYNAQY